MMMMPARRARWAGCGGSSAPQARHGFGRNGVYRRLASFACHPTELPPQGCAHLTLTGTADFRLTGEAQSIPRGVPLADPKNAPATATQPVDWVQAQRHEPVYGYTYTQPWRSVEGLHAEPLHDHADVEAWKTAAHIIPGAQ